MRRIISQPKSGFRKDIGIYTRSKWEANMCRYFNFNKTEWQYESKVFYFNDSSLLNKKIKRGTLSYTPDFYLPETDNFLEVKGFLNSKGKTKLRRFKKYYPEEAKKLQFVIYDPYSRSVENGKVMNFLLNDLKKDMCDIYSYKEIQDKLGGLIPNWE